jgi:hypothetical protein
MGVGPAIFESAGQRSEHYVPGVYGRSFNVSSPSGISAGNLCILNKNYDYIMRFNETDNGNELISYIPLRTTAKITTSDILQGLTLKATSKVHSKYRVNIGLDGEVFDEDNNKRFWDRAELFLVSPADRPCDIWFGSIAEEDLPGKNGEYPTFENSDLKWSINVRNATDDNPYAFSIFNNEFKSYALQIKEKTKDGIKDLSVLINEGLEINNYLMLNGSATIKGEFNILENDLIASNGPDKYVYLSCADGRKSYISV